MFKMIAATLVALYLVFLIFGDEARRPEAVARAEPPRSLDLNFSAWLQPAVAPVTPRTAYILSKNFGIKDIAPECTSQKKSTTRPKYGA